MDTKKELEFFGVDFDVLFDLCGLLKKLYVPLAMILMLL